MNRLILTINPGSTSTKVAVFAGDNLIWVETLRHDPGDLAEYTNVADQYVFRKQVVLDTLKARGTKTSELAAVVGRGGTLKPLCGGTYTINELMLEELRQAKWGQHASNLGAILAQDIAQPLGIPCFIVDPPTVDELDPVARISGMPELTRKSLFHALNQKAAARRAAKQLGKEYVECRLVVAHLGGGISVGAHKDGRVVDVNNALDGEGPFSPERSGGLPVGDLVRLATSGQMNVAELQRKITGNGGLVAYLGTSDVRAIEQKIQGDSQTRRVLEAMAYQIAKEIGACATVLNGQVDAVIITGGLAYSKFLVEELMGRVNYIAPILLFPGEDEMQALAEGGYRILTGEEQAREYV